MIDFWPFHFVYSLIIIIDWTAKMKIIKDTKLNFRPKTQKYLPTKITTYQLVIVILQNKCIIILQRSQFFPKEGLLIKLLKGLIFLNISKTYNICQYFFFRDKNIIFENHSNNRSKDASNKPFISWSRPRSFFIIFLSPFSWSRSLPVSGARAFSFTGSRPSSISRTWSWSFSFSRPFAFFWSWSLGSLCSPLPWFWSWSSPVWSVITEHSYFYLFNHGKYYLWLFCQQF